jgi:NodT family efflux transporter outer membrane factor (OMF) lipoprotein
MPNTKPIVHLAGAALILLAGCAVGPDFSRPAAPKTDRYTREGLPSAFIATDGRSQRLNPTAQVQADWWKLFSSNALNQIVEEALASNPTLQAAQARLTESQDALRAGYGVFFPQADVDAGAKRQRVTPISFGINSPGSIFNLYTLGATISYALDIFGGQRRAVEGLRAQVDYQQYTTDAAYLTLTGNLVDTVISHAAYADEIDITKEILTLIREQAKIAQVQADAGTEAYANVLSFQSQLATTEATLPGLKQKLVQSEHLLATLVGKTPAEWNPATIPMENLIPPVELPLSLPSQLVRQRPDILAAEAQWHAASAQIGVATAALFPSFTLTGGFGFNNPSTSAVLNDNSKFWSLGAAVDMPVFHGGSLWYQRKAAQAAYREAGANYRQTVLSAFAQVADVLNALQNDAESVKAQAKAVTAAGQAAHLLTVNYQAGTASYLQAITADTQYYQSRISYIQSQAQRLQDIVGLFVALGGGWWNAARDSHPPITHP